LALKNPHGAHVFFGVESPKSIISEAMGASQGREGWLGWSHGREGWPGINNGKRVIGKA